MDYRAILMETLLTKVLILVTTNFKFDSSHAINIKRSFYLLVFLVEVTSVSASAKRKVDAALYEDECGRGIPNILTYTDRSCYYKEAPDALPYADGRIFLFPSNSIFFIETSCKGGLNHREACSIESAAKAHPDRQINVLFTGPVQKDCLEDDPMTSLRIYTNVHFFRIHLLKYVEGTPLESVFLSENFNRSRYPTYHTSSLLRFLTLYKYGGIYLDLDVVVLKPFDELPDSKNWVGLEDNQGREVGSALIAASTDEIGRLFIETAVSLLKRRYNPLLWIRESGNTIKSVLRTICSTPLLKRMSTYTCQGFAVYPADAFYQLHNKRRRNQFFANGNRYTVKNSIALHLLHSVSYKNVIFKNSTYANIMKDYCPRVYQTTVTILPGVQGNHKATPTSGYTSVYVDQQHKRQSAKIFRSYTTEEPAESTETSTFEFTDISTVEVTDQITSSTESTIRSSSTDISSTLTTSTDDSLNQTIVLTYNQFTTDYVTSPITVSTVEYTTEFTTNADEYIIEVTNELSDLRDSYISTIPFASTSSSYIIADIPEADPLTSTTNIDDVLVYRMKPVKYRTKEYKIKATRTTTSVTPTTKRIPKQTINFRALDKMKNEKKNRKRLRTNRNKLNTKKKSRTRIKKITIMRSPKKSMKIPESFTLRYAKFWRADPDAYKHNQKAISRLRKLGILSTFI